VQTGLAVGDTQAEREKAEFTQLKFWVSNAWYDTFNTFSSLNDTSQGSYMYLAIERCIEGTQGQWK